MISSCSRGLGVGFGTGAAAGGLGCALGVSVDSEAEVRCARRNGLRDVCDEDAIVAIVCNDEEEVK